MALVFYTDGLVERRGELIDTGIDRLAAAVRSVPADALCDHLMASTAEEHPTDDIALVVVRRPPASESGDASRVDEPTPLGDS